MEPSKLEKGDIVQIDPDHDDVFGGCLMVVTEPKSWGAQGYVSIPGKDGGSAYYRCPFEAMEPTGGKVEWLAGSADD
jgi:hypothetical protein